MSSSKSFTIQTDKLPRFDSCHYKHWVDEIMPTISMMDLQTVVLGELLPLAPSTLAEPDFPVPIGSATELTAIQLSKYSAQLAQWNSARDWNTKKQSTFDSKNVQAIGLLNTALSTGLWEQVKMKDATTSRTTAKIWDWLKTTFATVQFVEVLDNFEFMKTFKLDLSNPIPQIAKYCFHYSRLPMKGTTPTTTTAGAPAPATAPTPESIVSQSMAALILISSLPLNADPTQ